MCDTDMSEDHVFTQPVSFRVADFHSYETECPQRLQAGQDETDSGGVNTIAVFLN